MAARKTTTTAKKKAAPKTPAKAAPKATAKPAPETAAKATDKKMSQIHAALAILGKARKPMTCKEMVEAMEAKRLWKSPGGKTPHATLYSAILRDMRKGDAARFKKAAPGKFTTAGN